MEFLYPWVLLPQSMYPSDLRSVTIAHTGGDVYGTIGLNRAGSVSYQGYGGTKPVDPQGGFTYGLEDSGFQKLNYSGTEAGYDVRWSTPVQGLRVGTSYMWSDTPITATLSVGKAMLPGTADMHSNQYAGYGEYRYHGLTVATEYRPESKSTPLTFSPIQAVRVGDYKSYFVSAAYRFNRWFQLGKKDLTGALNGHFTFSIRHFASTMDEVLNTLSGACYGLPEIADNQAEAAYEAMQNSEPCDYEPDCYEPDYYEPE
jgi:hypothetical protein